MNWILILPELSLVSLTALLLVRACLPARPAWNYHAILAAAAVVVVISMACVRFEGELFQKVYRIDRFSQIFKTLLSMGFFLVILLGDTLAGIDRRYTAEEWLLLSLGTLAMMLMASGVHLLVLFLSLELSSYALYVLVLMHRHDNPLRMVPGLHFFLIGASISAVTLLGMALLYSVCGTLYIDGLVRRLPALMHAPTAAAGAFLAMAGFFFKLTLFPFHIWAPDTYEGSPNQVAAFIATVSKLAAVAVLLRIMVLTQGSGDLAVKALIGMAILSMTVGNLAAIAQKDFKRLMAFSSIAHAGYLLIGLLSMTAEGRSATLFYGAAVLVLKFTCFLVMTTLATDGRNLQISELAGLHRRAPVLALALMLALFGLAGIPPTIGFAGKFLIFTAAVKSGYLALVIIAMVNVVISLYYYLLVLKSAYIDIPQPDQPDLKTHWRTRMLAVAMITIIIGAGFFPNVLLELMHSAALRLP